jgi:hypothetical protein
MSSSIAHLQIVYTRPNACLSITPIATTDLLLLSLLQAILVVEFDELF